MKCNIKGCGKIEGGFEDGICRPCYLFITTGERAWVGLTAEEAAECWTTSATQTWKNFEAKLKEKNNP